MSSAKNGKSKFALCLHISKFGFDVFDRANARERDEAKRNRAAQRTKK